MNQSQDYTLNISRFVPGRIRLITVLLYAAAAFFTLIGLRGGLIWGLAAVGSLVLGWALMGQARVIYIYELSGTRLTVHRVSGFKSRPKTERFAVLDLSRMRIMAPEGDPALVQAEHDTENQSPKRITYNISAHDPGTPCSVLYTEGTEEEEGRWLKVFLQPDAGLIQCIRRLCPGRVIGYDRQ